MTKKTQTKKQREAAQRNWQRLQLKGIIANVIKCEIIGQVDKEIIISLLKNALIKDMIKRRNDKVFKDCTFKKSYRNTSYIHNPISTTLLEKGLNEKDDFPTFRKIFNRLKGNK